MAPVITAIDPEPLRGLKQENHSVCTLEATVTTGLEDVAASECKEKLGVDCVLSRGRVFFDVEISQVPEVLKLRSVDNVNVVITMVKNFSFPDTREQCFEKLYKLAESPDWHKGTQVWRQTFEYEKDPISEVQLLTDSICTTPRPDIDLKKLKSTSAILVNLPQDVLPTHLREQPGKRVEEDVIGGGEEEEKDDCVKDQENGDLESNEREDNDAPNSEKTSSPGEMRAATGPKFRVSCSRTGTTHKFGSPEAARQFGAGVNEIFGWPVDLSHFDMEVLLCIDTEFVYVAICLTREPLFKRNLTSFGPTNLRASLCYNLVRLAAPLPGEILVDPMCGGATIPMEGSLTYPAVLHLGGDNFGQAVKRSRENIDCHLNKGRSLVVDVARWDVTRLPLRSQIVDAVVSDLPFGKRLGSQADNRVLYFGALVELARVTKVRTGRAVLLTYDKNSMIRNIKRVHTLWKSGVSRTINIGGLSAVVYILHRTSLLSDPSLKVDWSARKRRHEKGE